MNLFENYIQSHEKSQIRHRHIWKNVGALKVMNLWGEYESVCQKYNLRRRAVSKA